MLLGGTAMLKRYLLAPGPTPVPPEVLGAMGLPIIHHRSPDFIPVMESVREGLKWLYQTSQEVLMLSSSGTGGMEAAVTNFTSPGEKALVVNGGKFGERWGKILRAHGVEVTELMVEWGTPADPAGIAAALDKDKDIRAVFIQASETSTGVYHDVKAVAGEVRKRGEDVLLVVDAISGLVAHDLRFDEWGIDVMVAGAQKGLMIPPGLAFISASERAWKRAEGSTSRRFYFDLKKEHESIKKNQTAFTPPVTLIIGLDEALRILRMEGLEKVFERHARLAEATREAAGALGLKLFAKGSPSNALTAIEAPEGIDGQEIYKRMREDYGITGAGGQDKLKGKVFRIAHLGYAGTFDVITAIAALEMVLVGLGHDVKLGSGVARAQELLMAKDG
jgi:aspartate aminotransferase-like enzyme